MNKKPLKATATSKDAAAAVMEERRRIYRELHDRVLQLLSSIKLKAELCRCELIKHSEALEQELRTIETTADKATTEIRGLLVDGQTPSDLVAGTLERRLREELEIFSARAGLEVEFHCDIGPHSLPIKVERELYFALREGVINAIRHARTSELKLSLSQKGNICKARLQDNGSGFDLTAAQSSTHYGLRVMKERIQNVGGRFDVKTAPGEGTRISITVPVDQKASVGVP